MNLYFYFLFVLIEQAFQFMTTLKMIRTMPNTPMQIGEGCTVYSPGKPSSFIQCKVFISNIF